LHWGSTPLSTGPQDIEHVTALPENLLDSNRRIVSSAVKTENWHVLIQLTVYWAAEHIHEAVRRAEG
jgi:hypothetical protein